MHLSFTQLRQWYLDHFFQRAPPRRLTFLITHSPLWIPRSYLSMALHTFLMESPHAFVDPQWLDGIFLCHKLHRYRQSLFVHQVESDQVNHRVPVNHWHYSLWAELSVFTVFQHLYQYRVYAIVNDIQADASFVSIHLHPKTLNQLNLRVDVSQCYIFGS